LCESSDILLGLVQKEQENTTDAHISFNFECGDALFFKYRKFCANAEWRAAAGRSARDTNRETLHSAHSRTTTTTAAARTFDNSGAGSQSGTTNGEFGEGGKMEARLCAR
jgi:hypothetical protein